MVACGAPAQQGPAAYTINGTDEAFEDGKIVYLTKLENNEFIPVDTLTVENNTIHFEGMVEEPEIRYIAVENANPRGSELFFYFFLLLSIFASPTSLLLHSVRLVKEVF